MPGVDSKFRIEVSSFRRGYRWEGDESLRHLRDVNCIDSVFVSEAKLIKLFLKPFCF